MPGKTQLPSREEALPGRSEATVVSANHAVNRNPMYPPFPEGMQMAMFGMTGHTEVVRIVFDPQTISYKDLLKVFWENHNPTHGMKQYDDVGTQYRSAIYAFGTEQLQSALRSKAVYEQELTRKQLGRITTEIREAGPFYYAEDYHQQYLHKIPGGFCGLRGTGIPCPVADGEEP